MSDYSSPASSPRRLLLLVVLGAVLGIVAGAAAWLLVRMIAIVTNLAFFQRVDWHLPSLSTLRFNPIVFPVAIGGAFVVSLIARWAPTVRGHGLPEAMEAVLARESKVSPRTAIAKPISASVAIGTGGPFGAEGPIIVTGAAFGSFAGQLLRVTVGERKVLLAAGAAAGMTALFGSPVAAVVLAVELLLFEFSRRSLVVVIAACAVATGMHNLIFGLAPVFAVPTHDPIQLRNLGWHALLGLICGVCAWVIVKGLDRSEIVFEKMPLGRFWHPVIGAIGFATIGFFVPEALGVGYDVITDILTEPMTIGFLLLILVAKIASWWIAVSSGTSGGTLAPLLLMGTALGSAFAVAVNQYVPGARLSPTIFGLVGMSAIFGAATKAHFAAVLFVFEATQSYEMLLPLLIAGGVALLVTEITLNESVITTRLSREGVTLVTDLRVDAFELSKARDAMEPLAPGDEELRAEFSSPEVSPDVELTLVVHLMERRDAERVLVVDRGIPVGVITHRAIARIPLRAEEDVLQEGLLDDYVGRVAERRRRRRSVREPGSHSGDHPAG